MLCLAGPGSGKTFTLVQHILFLTQNEHVPPDRILVLTFSRAAALEMQERYLRDVQKQTGSPPEKTPFFGTFHALFFQILRKESRTPLSIADTKTRVNIIKRLLGDIEHRTPDEESVLEAMAEISSYKNGTLDTKTQQEDRNLPYLLRGYGSFLKESHLIDFDDMASRCLELLRSDPLLLAREQSRFDAILVDEFQDINAVQLDATLLLGASHRNYFVVGDDDQSIYGFRGADPNVFRKFLKACPDAEQVTLDINYRCQAKILHAALAVIAQNKNRIPKKILAGRKPGAPVEMKGFENLDQETRAEAAIIKEAISSGKNPSDIAVILRTHQKAWQIGEALSLLGVPVSESVFHVPAFVFTVLSDIRDYFLVCSEFAEGAADPEHIRHIMNRPQRYFIAEDFGEKKVSAKELLMRTPPESPAGREMARFLEDFHRMETLRASSAVIYLRSTMGLEAFEKKEQRGKEDKRITEIFDGVQKMAAHFSHDGLAKELDGRMQKLRTCKGKKKKTGEGVRLLTCHACKGLEFPIVILPELNEGVLPSRQAVGDAALEEERRLLYVAMTRAKEQLYLHYLDAQGKRMSGFLSPLSYLNRPGGQAMRELFSRKAPD